MSTSTSLARLEQLLPQLFQGSSPGGKAYLRFQLTTEISAAISMDWVRESLLVSSDKISPLPNLPAAVIGIMSARNRIFCVVDLAQVLKVPSTLVSARQYHTIVLGVAADNLPVDSLSATNYDSVAAERELFLGIAVDRIQGIARFTTDRICLPVANFPEQLNPYVCGAVIEEGNQILLLDFDRIANSVGQLEL